MITSGFETHPWFLWLFACLSAVAAAFFLGLGFYDLALGRDAIESIRQVSGSLETKEAFYRAYRTAATTHLMAGAVAALSAWIFYRLHRWWRRDPTDGV